MYFVNHDQLEKTVSDTSSRCNDHEAEFAVHLSRYLILQGYETSQVTILTMYSGQLFKIRSLMKQYAILKGVRATVVDNFQGEECDIIILTFVRSNVDGAIGFLKVSNRVNVALSRAKKGLYCIGNFECLKQDSQLWRDIIRDLDRADAIGTSLELYCQNHPDDKHKVSKGIDFRQMPEGGCLKPCDSRLDCGHTCPSTCHIADIQHVYIKCSKSCDKIICERNHRCVKRCHFGKECGDCTKLVDKKRTSCGHSIKANCAKDPDQIACTSICDKYRNCGHKCQARCGVDCNAFPCDALVEIDSPCGHKVKTRCSLKNNTKSIVASCQAPCNTLLECEHVCTGTCGKCLQGRLHMKCDKKCDRTLVCGHLCKEKCSINCPPCAQKCPNQCNHSKCPSTCGYPCSSCMEKCVWRCKHKACTQLCNEQCDRDLCMEPCTIILNCEHPCIGLCGESCPRLCRICNKAKVEEIFFGTEDEPDARFIELADCGHVLEAEGLIGWLNTEPESNGSTSIQMKVCPKCKTIIRKTRNLNKFVQKCLHDLELVKKKLYGDVKENRKLQMNLNKKICAFTINLSALMNTGGLNITSAMTKWHNDLIHETAIHNKKNCLSLPLIERKKNAFTIFELLHATFKNADEALQSNYTALDKKIVKAFISQVNDILCFMKTFNNSKQQLTDINEDFKFQYKVSVILKEVCNRPLNEAGCEKLRCAFQLAATCGRITEEIRKSFSDLIEEAKRLLPGLGITAEEKNMIMKAMNFGQGHWFKCPNGHVYAIGECGGAMQLSRCNECNEVIGGGSHRLESTNAVATEMDGATEPAYNPNAELNLEQFMFD